jgi:hypothetical protein
LTNSPPNYCRLARGLLKGLLKDGLDAFTTDFMDMTTEAIKEVAFEKFCD